MTQSGLINRCLLYNTHRISNGKMTVSGLSSHEILINKPNPEFVGPVVGHVGYPLQPQPMFLARNSEPGLIFIPTPLKVILRAEMGKGLVGRWGVILEIFTVGESKPFLRWGVKNNFDHFFPCYKSLPNFFAIFIIL